jgi:PTS system glucose-specific IIC component
MKQKTVSFGEIDLNSVPKSNIKEMMSRLSRGLMLPIATLPIAGIVLGIGGAITAHTSINSTGYIIGQIIATPGSLIFTILPLIFAIALAINFTKDSGVAGLSAVIGYLTFVSIQAALVITHTSYHADNPSSFSVSFLWYKFTGETGYEQFNGLFSNFLGFRTLLTSVFGGIVIGLVVAKLYNQFKDIQLPTIIGFFSGVRFIPVVTIAASLIISFLFAMT